MPTRLPGARRRRARPRPERPRRRLGPSRLPLWALAAAVLLSGGAWLDAHRTMTLVVDGEVRSVETYATTVGDVLDRQGVEVGPDDRVHPPPDEPLVDGMRVEVVHARTITLLVGGTRSEAVVAALTVDGVLEALDAGALQAPGGRRSLVRPSRMSRVESGMVVELSDPIALTIAEGGERIIIVTDEATVGGVLARAGVELRGHDRVTPDPRTPVEHGMVVTVARVEHRREVREEPIAYATEERRTDALREGERREAEAGREGLRRIVERVTLVDGEEERREEIRTEVVREPRPRVVEVGTAPRRTPAPSPSPAPEPDPAPEEPEPAPDPAPRNVEEGGASWYDNPAGGFTAAHRTIPRGATVTVTNLANGRSVDVRINDRGPFVEGRVIDLNRAAFAELASPSKGVIHVRIEW